MTKALGDRVKLWITHNEPWCISFLGHVSGEHAPGEKNNWFNALACNHHLMLSHGWSVPVIRGNVPDAEVGMTVNLCPAEPASGSAADAEATRHFDGFFNRWYLDPLFGRGYPADRIADLVADGTLTGPELPFVEDGDLDTAAVKTDFLGINYYSRGIIRSDNIPEDQNDPITVIRSDEETDMGWEVSPQGLEDILRRVHTDYGPDAIYITENGAAYSTGPNDNGQVQDTQRQSYLERHLVACHRAIEDGVPLKGYFAWSLLDNFEWAFGYEKRFGLVYVDYETQQRTPKMSAHWFGNVAQNSGTMNENAQLLLLLLGTSSAFAQVESVKVVSDDAGYRLKVGDKDFFVRGMNWGYIPIGHNYSYDLWSKPGAFIKRCFWRNDPPTEDGRQRHSSVQYRPPKWVAYIHKTYGFTAVNHLMGHMALTSTGLCPQYRLRQSSTSSGHPCRRQTNRKAISQHARSSALHVGQ